MKIPFDADEFGKRLDGALLSLQDIQEGFKHNPAEYDRLGDKVQAVRSCIDIHDSHNADYLAGYLAAARGSSVGMRQGYSLVRGYLNEYDRVS